MVERKRACRHFGDLPERGCKLVRYGTLIDCFSFFRVPKACREIELRTVHEKMYLHARIPWHPRVDYLEKRLD